MIKQNEFEEKLRRVFAENGLVIPVGEEDTQLELDSLRLIALIVEVENTFDVEVPDEYLAQGILSSFRDFYELLVLLNN